MPIQETSREGFSLVTRNGKRFTQAEKVLNFIQLKGFSGATIAEIARETGIEPGKVSARMKDLRERHWVFKQPISIDADGTIYKTRKDSYTKTSGIIWYSTALDFQGRFEFDVECQLSTQ